MKDYQQPLKLGFVLHFSILSFFLLLIVGISQAQTYNYSELIARITNDSRTGIKNVGTLDAWVANQKANGSWSEFAYGTLNSSNAMTTDDNHVLRLWHLAAAVSQSNHARYNNDSYKDALLKGLEFWYNAHTIDPNWWYNRIYNPQKLGEILLFLREFEGFIPTTSSAGIDEPEILSLFQPQAINDITAHGTGANAIDIGLHYVYRGILTQNSSLLENTRNKLEQILSENIKGDHMFQDHGPQIQISSYGWVFADGITRLAAYLASSPAAFDIKGENFGKVIRFIKDTQTSSIRGTSWDFSVMGRAVSRVNALNANMNYLQKMADFIDPSNASIYLDALSRIKGNKSADYNITALNKHFWTSDYTQHSRRGYLFTVRNVSTRTVEAESGNGENLKANYFSYGANFISVDGSEYKNIMPYWDWCMIPGTTFPYTTSYPKRTDWGANFGNTTFVGGVSDGLYGASVLDMNKAGAQAKKSWFFFDNEVVCLGAGITSTSNKEVRTTLNQAKMADVSYIKEAGSTTETMQTVSSTAYSNQNLSYIRNGKTAYFFPNKGDIKYTMKSQSGSWQSINSTGSAQTESGYVFSLWFDHGINPSNDSYSYIVAPGIDSKAKAEAYDISSIEIISNTSALQAVANKNLDILQVIFHQAGTVHYDGLSITVNQACALMLRDKSIVSVSDPAQINSVILVKIEVEDKSYQKYVSLPSNTDLKGSTITIDFEIPATSNPTTKENQLVQIDCIPNPTPSGRVTVYSNMGNEALCDVRNVNGQTIYNAKFFDQTEVDLQHQPSGIYYVSVYYDNSSYSKKIIKY